IRDYKVTGVQTCALPICVVAWHIRAGEPVHQPTAHPRPGILDKPSNLAGSGALEGNRAVESGLGRATRRLPAVVGWRRWCSATRSEERRVGKEVGGGLWA